MTPAQASGHPNFITDVPVQGPTDPSMREADCRFARARIPMQQNCVDCEGQIPMWTRQNSILAGNVSFGGVGMPGFALAAAGDPDIWRSLPAAQQAWVTATLGKLNTLIVQATGTSCATWAPNIMAASQCFQGWFNAAKMGLTKPDGSPVVLRTDGIFDKETLDALRTVAAMRPKDFPEPFPGTQLPGETGEGKKGLSKGAIAGIAAGGALVIGGTVWALSKKKRRSK